MSVYYINILLPCLVLSYVACECRIIGLRYIPISSHIELARAGGEGNIYRENEKRIVINDVHTYYIHICQLNRWLCCSKASLSCSNALSAPWNAENRRQVARKMKQIDIFSVWILISLCRFSIESSKAKAISYTP